MPDLPYEEERELQALQRELDRHRQVRYNWLRFLVTLAAGSFAVLAGLQPAKTGTTGTACALFLRSTWGTLALGILSGAVALYGEASAAAAAETRCREAIARLTSGSPRSIGSLFPRPRRAAAPAAETPAPPRPLFLWAERLCYASLTASVLALAACAILR